MYGCTLSVHRMVTVCMDVHCWFPRIIVTVCSHTVGSPYCYCMFAHCWFPTWLQYVWMYTVGSPYCYCMFAHCWFPRRPVPAPETDELSATGQTLQATAVKLQRTERAVNKTKQQQEIKKFVQIITTALGKCFSPCLQSISLWAGAMKYKEYDTNTSFVRRSTLLIVLACSLIKRIMSKHQNSRPILTTNRPSGRVVKTVDRLGIEGWLVPIPVRAVATMLSPLSLVSGWRTQCLDLQMRRPRPRELQA